MESHKLCNNVQYNTMYEVDEASSQLVCQEVVISSDSVMISYELIVISQREVGLVTGGQASAKVSKCW